MIYSYLLEDVPDTVHIQNKCSGYGYKANNRKMLTKYFWLYPEYVGTDVAVETVELFYKTKKIHLQSHTRVSEFFEDKSLAGIPPFHLIRSFAVEIKNSELKEYDERSDHIYADGSLSRAAKASIYRAF